MKLRARRLGLSAAVRLALLGAMAAAAACHRTPSPPRYQPYESVAQILADFEAHRGDDLYRFGYPKDLAGQNLFRATLTRIQNYQTLYPGVFADILAVARGQIHERLGDYAAALHEYDSLGGDPSPDLAAVAEQGRARVRELADVALRRCDTSSLQRYLDDLEQKRQALTRLADKFQSTPYRTLALIEAEKADVQRAILLFSNRYVLPGGLEPSLKAMKEVVERHAQSCQARRHELLLADFHMAAADDYVALHDPAQTDFDDAAFDSLLAEPREVYFKISREDGAPEKLEARAKLEALEAFARTIHDLRK